MLNPSSLDIISDPILYQIDPKTHDLYLISQEEKPKYSSSLYENDAILRSLFLKQQSFNKEFLNLLYTESHNERIYYILNYDGLEKYVMSFKLPTQDNDVVVNTLNKLKDNKLDIISWIRKNCEVTKAVSYTHLTLPTTPYV